MNISKISFGIRYDDGLDILSNSVKKDMGDTLKFSKIKELDKDTYVRNPRMGRHEKETPYQPKHIAQKQTQMPPKNQQAAIEFLKKSERKSKIKKTAGSIIGGTLAAFMLGQGIAAYNAPSKLITVPTNNYNSIFEVAGTYDSNVNAILTYNEMDDYSEFYSRDEIKIPAMYDYVQDEIDKVQEKLHSKHISPSDRAKCEKRMSKLKAKQRLQKELATVYTDGKFVYFTINNLPSDSKYQGGINVEEFKQIFDIKDKAIRENNDIYFDWGYSAEEGGYKDYTVYRINTKETIKVPINAIKTGSEINLD